MTSTRPAFSRPESSPGFAARPELVEIMVTAEPHLAESIGRLLLAEVREEKSGLWRTVADFIDRHRHNPAERLGPSFSPGPDYQTGTILNSLSAVIHDD